MTVCPGCAAAYPADAGGLGGHDRFNASDACWLAYGVVSALVMAHPDELAVWHQTSVDAYALQHVEPRSPAITTAFALNGLYLVMERRLSGLQARAAHVHLAATHAGWPTYERPDGVGTVTVSDVRTTKPHECAADIADWGRSVWYAWTHVHAEVADLTDRRLSGWHAPVRS